MINMTRTLKGCNLSWNRVVISKICLIDVAIHFVLRAMNPVVRSDVVVSTFLDSVGGYRHKERRDILLDILDVDLDWHMHTISDGERRRVQLVMGLMSEWDVLLLDEVSFQSYLNRGAVNSITIK